jgi:hypothetical protein
LSPRPQTGWQTKSVVDAGSEQQEIAQIHPAGHPAALVHETTAGLSQKIQE